uniref:Nuclear envelope integral membrane protein 2 n=1 Tax=Nomascus leucogenys TaxID=61853 RepID=M3Z9W6_NOMLE
KPVDLIPNLLFLPPLLVHFLFRLCKALKEKDLIRTPESDCYCYNQNSQVEWKYIWSTISFRIAKSYHYKKNPSNRSSIFIYSVVYFRLIHPNPLPLQYGYIIHSKYRFSPILVNFIIFFFFFFFFYPTFYYSSGTVLGVLMTLVFVLLLVKRFIPKYSTFWALMVGCWFASVYIVCQLMEDLKWLWYENRIYVLGYVLIVGFFSFVVCYKHGPLADDRSRSLLMWMLRLLSLVLVYAGVAMPQFAYAAIILLMSSWSLHYPLRAFSYMRWKMKQWFTSKELVVKYLTEDEYREQADAETNSALEELRRACRKPDFPSWLVVSRLHTPSKFADFVLGGSHLSPEEISVHEEQYGLGGAFLEEQLFNPSTA